MNVEQMFEKLEYEVFAKWDIVVNKNKEKRFGITYRKNDGGRITELLFNPVFKRIQITEYEEYNDNKPTGFVSYPIELIEAIKQQMKELGW